MSAECPGTGKCHGCLVWCETCGDVGDVCDGRLAGVRCDEHEVPPTREDLARRGKAAADRVYAARQELREASEEADEVKELIRQRRVYDRQLYEQDEAYFTSIMKMPAWPARGRDER